MNLTLHIWRQPGPKAPGKMVRYEVTGVNEHASFLEMLDVLNEQLVTRGEEPVTFEHDCREGICGSCGFMINGEAHGPDRGTTVCQLHMRHFKDGDTLHLEPWRARAFPVIKDLMVDRNAFDRIVQAGGFITARTGSAPDANAIPIPKADVDRAMDALAPVPGVQHVAAANSLPASALGDSAALCRVRLRRFAARLSWTACQRLSSRIAACWPGCTASLCRVRPITTGLRRSPARGSGRGRWPGC